MGGCGCGCVCMCVLCGWVSEYIVLYLAVCLSRLADGDRRVFMRGQTTDGVRTVYLRHARVTPQTFHCS